MRGCSLASLCSRRHCRRAASAECAGTAARVAAAWQVCVERAAVHRPARLGGAVSVLHGMRVANACAPAATTCERLTRNVCAALGRSARRQRWRARRLTYRLALATTLSPSCVTRMRRASGRTRCVDARRLRYTTRTRALTRASRFAQHHCNPLIVPSNTSMQFYCKMDPTDGVFLCYFRRVAWRGANAARIMHRRGGCLQSADIKNPNVRGVPRQPMKAAIALQCSTGNCVYENAAPPPTPSRRQGFWTVRGAQFESCAGRPALKRAAPRMRCALTHVCMWFLVWLPRAR